MNTGMSQWISAAVLLFSSSVYAAMADTEHGASSAWQALTVSAAGGVDWYNVANTHLVVSPYETDSNQIQSIATDGAWKVGIGYALLDNTPYYATYFDHLLFEVNVYQTFTTLQGSVWQYQLPQFNNYNFKAPVTSTRLMFDFKPIPTTWKNMAPYAILGIGVVWNEVSYNETVTAAALGAQSALLLPGQTTAQLAGDLGAGYRVALSSRVSATAEYIYAFLGNGSAKHYSKNAVNIVTSPRFALQTSTLLFGVTLSV